MCLKRISLWSQGGAASSRGGRWGRVRRLNPFEVREVLQAAIPITVLFDGVSIPLKSGRCCKANRRVNRMIISLNPFEVREVLQVGDVGRSTDDGVSIPLKSGRCCKINGCVSADIKLSQSLWSQGGAARVLYKTYLLKSISYLLVFVKNFLTKSYFPKFCKELKTGTIRSSFQNNISGFQSLDTVAQYPIFLTTCHGGCLHCCSGFSMTQAADLAVHGGFAHTVCVSK